jgi:DNA invertase Pin-like site-specific DNA recombinase
MRVAIYARVSTTDQTAENQLLELRGVAERQGWEVTTEYVEHGISGAKGRDKRPQLDQMLRAVARRDVDKVMAWSVDRLGRSLVDLLATLGEFHATGTDLYLHQQGIDTGTPAGKAMFSMMGVFAEFERAIIQERVRAGLQRARAEGKQLGRRRVAPEVEQHIRQLRAQGVGVCKTAKMVGCGVGTVQRVDRELT